MAAVGLIARKPDILLIPDVAALEASIARSIDRSQWHCLEDA
jgi:hypothetical protein